MGAHVNADWTVVAANPALHAARRVRHDLSRRQYRVFIPVALENLKKIHMLNRRQAAGKVMGSKIIIDIWGTTKVTDMS